MKIPISMLGPPLPELVAPAGADEVAELLPVSPGAAVPLSEVLAKPPLW